MNNTFACGHPLEVSWPDFTFVTFKVLMIEATLKHISDCLKPSMRVVRESCREPYFEIIKHQKRI